MSAELQRRTSALERRFLRPDRAPLDPTIVAAPSGPATWLRAIALGRLPAEFADDPLRRFRTSVGQARRVPELADTLERVRGMGGPLDQLAPLPCDRQAARLLCSDPAGLLAAEQHARELVAALGEFGLEPRPRKIAWRIAGCAIEVPTAGDVPLGDLRPIVGRLRDLMARLTGRSLERPHAHHRFRLAQELLEWAHRRPKALALTIPAEFGPLAQRRLGELPDPFEPWLRVLETGYCVWGLTRSTIELAAPFPAPSEPRIDKRGRAEIRRRPSPRPVWSESLDRLRATCMRGDAAWIEQERRTIAAVTEPGAAPLIHYAVYGGPEVLDALLACDAALALDERDDEGRSGLMLAASTAREGPLAIRGEPRVMPPWRGSGLASARWLLARAVELDARDERGWTALHWAAHELQAEGASLLIQAGAPIEARDALGRTPLLVALSSPERAPNTASLRELVDVLLAAGADADARDDRGWSALHYLAVSPRLDHRALARPLQRAGASPSRDRLGRSPAELGGEFPTRGESAFDLRTGVAAGPGAWPSPARAPELERALCESSEAGDERRRQALAVWADWLQSRGDPRGELLAAELTTGALGRKRRRAQLAALAQLARRLAFARDRGLLLADPTRVTDTARVQVVRERGWVVGATIEPRLLCGSDSFRIHHARLALASLLEHEPLLTTLRIRCIESARWPELLAALETLPPAPQVRRLVLECLPTQAPRVELLAAVFPRVRELRLHGQGKIDQLALAWPTIEALTIRHGDTSEWGRGGSRFELDLPNLRALDLALPVGGRTSDDELAGFRALLDRLGPPLARLRLAPVRAETLLALLERPPSGLRELVLDRIRGRAIELLAERLVQARAAWLHALASVELGVVAQVVEQRQVELAGITAMLASARVVHR